MTRSLGARGAPLFDRYRIPRGASFGAGVALRVAVAAWFVAGCSHAASTGTSAGEADAGLPSDCEAFVTTLHGCLVDESSGRTAATANVAAVRAQLLAARGTLTPDALRAQCRDAASSLRRSCR